MENPFGSEAISAGYARCRPPVHPRVLELALAPWGPFRRALDVGCGAGLSTRSLAPFAHHCIGIDPAESMLRRAPDTAPGARFAAARAEAIPLGNGSVDLMTAAGSLNYADLDRFFPEARRVLAPGGLLLVYDFSPGACFRDAGGLEAWFGQFLRRYPPVVGESRALDPEVLAGLDSGFRVRARRQFEIGLRLAPGFYLDYMMTETNVAAAVRRGAAADEIRAWCAETLAPVWNGETREVLFRGYFVCLEPGGG